MVAVGDGTFVALGMPCATRRAEESAIECDQPLVAAQFDARTGEWSELAPPEGRTVGDKTSAAVVTGAGMAASKALFVGAAGDGGPIVAYDTSSSKWSILELPPDYSPAREGSTSETGGDSSIGGPRSWCVVNGVLSLARVDETRAVVHSWTLEGSALTWKRADDQALPSPPDGEAVYSLDCGGSELLLMIGTPGGPLLDEVLAFESAGNRWGQLPTPPFLDSDSAATAIHANDTWLAWPGLSADPGFYELSGTGGWRTRKKPVVGYAQLNRFGANVLVYSNSDDDGSSTLLLYGVAP